jgi:hypothetical protein
MKRTMELSGKVIAVLEPRGGVSKTGNAWKVQEYVIETHDQYPRKMCFDVFGEDKINQFNIQVGEMVRVSFDIDAREYQGRWYNSIRAWNVDRNLADPMAPQMAPMGTLNTTPFDTPSNQNSIPANAQAPTAPFVSTESEEDLPF